jgi:ABC-type uncharacterized transport system permease subunit
MRIELVKRKEPSRLMMWLTPVIAVVATMITGAIIFTVIGYNGAEAVARIFFAPLLDTYKWQDLGVKAAPLILIGAGLAIGFRANVWNIGAEGQYVMGGLAGTGIALLTWEMEGGWILPLMVLAGVIGGAAWAAVPAFLKTRLNVNEILSSLMLTYVAVQLLYYLMRGPWKDPQGFNFPQTRLFSDSQILPTVVPGTVVHLGVPIAFVVALGLWWVMNRSVFGFQIRVVGAAPMLHAMAGLMQSAPHGQRFSLVEDWQDLPVFWRWLVRSGKWCRRFPPAMALPPSSWPSSDGCTRRASFSQGWCWRYLMWEAKWRNPRSACPMPRPAFSRR